jgi:hypothetical protein
LNGALQRVLARSLAEHANTVDRVYQAIKIKGRVPVKLVEDVSDLRPSDELVREHNALNAMLPTNLQLLHGGHCDCPCAIIQLTLEQLRTRRRLAVRSYGRTGTGEEVPHPLAVVLECGLLEHRQWERQIATQHVPAVLTDFA